MAISHSDIIKNAAIRTKNASLGWILRFYTVFFSVYGNKYFVYRKFSVSMGKRKNALQK